MNISAHVLVAEDNPALLGVIALTLRNAGFEVTATHSGSDAWEYLRENDVDLVLADYNMPGMTGGSLCEAMRHDSRHLSTPIIVLTAFSADLQHDHEFESFGVSAVIRKPFSPRDVIAQVRQILRANRQPATIPAAAIGDVPSSPNSD